MNGDGSFGAIVVLLTEHIHAGVHVESHLVESSKVEIIRLVLKLAKFSCPRRQIMWLNNSRHCQSGVIELMGNQNVTDEMSSEFVLNGSGSCVPLPQHL